MGIFGAKPNVAAEQARMKAAQEGAARSERDKLAAATASKENLKQASDAEKQSARAAFIQGIQPDDEEARRKFLKKV